MQLKGSGGYHLGWAKRGNTWMLVVRNARTNDEHPLVRAGKDTRIMCADHLRNLYEAILSSKAGVIMRAVDAAAMVAKVTSEVRSDTITAPSRRST